MKIQNKIALIFTLLSSGIIAALSFFVYIFAAESISSSFFHRLEVRSDIIGHAILEENEASKPIYYDIKQRHLGDLPFERHKVTRSLIEAKTGDKSELPAQFFQDLQQMNEARFFRHDTTYVARKILEKGQQVVVVSSAVDLYGLAEMKNLKSLLVSGFLISLIFVFTFGKFFSAEIFKPIRRIIRNVKGINAHNLHQRLVFENSEDDIADLARTFNDMLDRLEVTFEIQNNFVSNASHEFKTPLTVISGEAQIALTTTELPDHAKQAFLIIYKESEKLEHLTSSMLSLAQTGFDGKKENWGKLRVDELIISVTEAVSKINPKNKVHINFDHFPEDEQQLVVSGNQVLLKAAFTNIVLNSCKYSDFKPVEIVISADEHFAMVDIIDDGIGIPDREIGQIFVPFFRASNTEKYKGYGVGLPMAHNIIRMHRGKVEVNSKVGEGTNFKTFLPLSTSHL